MKTIKTKFGREELIIETGKMAKQADGAVTVQYGGTLVLVTCVCSKKPRVGIDFFPLTVEYKEKTFAAGKIPGGFFKREGRPTEKEILSSRMIDRPIRPLFPEGMSNEVQIIATVLSSDGENDSDILALIGASSALTISDIPFNGPIAGVRVGLVNDQYVLNPTYSELEESKLDIIVVGNGDSVIMLEAGADKISEEKVLEAIKFGHESLKPLIKLQEEFQRQAGKPKRENIVLTEIDDEVYRKINKKYSAKMREILQLSEKQERIEKMESFTQQLMKEENAEEDACEAERITQVLSKVEKETVREFILKKKKRVDGRRFDEIRELSSEINILPKTHGCALFTRGGTQALAVVTLGTSTDEQRVETLKGQDFKTFMLHYNFPPFSVGETRPMRGPGRREIGHGALAEKALIPVIPSKDIFPYTIRVVSEILESNGSSSMATVCASSLSLMGAGVPLSDAVSGIAMGLVTDGKEFVILTDIAGVEDHFGDMDFKVAGTKDGITAVQMDLKVKGVGYDILQAAFAAARTARLKILEHMSKTIAKPLDEIAPNAPKIVTLNIRPEKIKDVIGSGGKVIRKIIAETGADINIEDDGTCQVASSDSASLEAALTMIKGIIAEPEIGKVYDGRITKLMNFGAFCEFLPGQEALIHVSELSNDYVKEVADVVKEGQKVRVKIIGVDDQRRVKLSIKKAEETQDENDNDKDKA
ncbi:MAG: polyribonucleotide nucleotidyltransferase [Candidatus Omnitrophota bacterium]